MQLSQLQLSSFRNHTNLDLEFGPITAITGPNGSGKTAILEAVSYLSVAGSWKVDRDSEVIQWEQPFARVVSGDREIVLQRSPSIKRLRIDGISKRLSEVLGSLPTVIFQPDDSQLVHGSPSYRRKTLDRLLSQTQPGYAKALLTLQKILKQRNHLLKMVAGSKSSPSELSFWDQELVLVSQVIQAARKELLRQFSETVSTHFAELMPETLPAHLDYQESNASLEHLEQNRFKELAIGTTLYGPHREDLRIFLGDHPAEEVMSRGQTRAFVLAFRLAELSYIKEHLETPPVLLLDDIFAEFDSERRERIFKLLGEYQTILTETELTGLPKAVLNRLSVVALKG